MIQFEKLEKHFLIQKRFFNSSDGLALDEDPLALKASWHWQLAITLASGSGNWLKLATWWQLHHIGKLRTFGFQMLLVSMVEITQLGLETIPCETKDTAGPK